MPRTTWTAQTCVPLIYVSIRDGCQPQIIRRFLNSCVDRPRQYDQRQADTDERKQKSDEIAARFFLAAMKELRPTLKQTLPTVTPGFPVYTGARGWLHTPYDPMGTGPEWGDKI